MNKDYKFLNREVRIDLYGYCLNLNISQNIIKERNKYSKHLDGKLDADYTIDGLHSYSDKNPMKSYIFISDTCSPGTVSHEAFHATLKIMKDIGNKLSKKSEESFAYLLGYIVDEIYKLLEDYNDLNIS